MSSGNLVCVWFGMGGWHWLGICMMWGPEPLITTDGYTLCYIPPNATGPVRTKNTDCVVVNTTEKEKKLKSTLLVNWFCLFYVWEGIGIVISSWKCKSSFSDPFWWDMLEDVNDANIARTMDHSDTTLPEKKHIYNRCLRQWPQEKGRATNLKRLEVRQLSRAGRGQWACPGQCHQWLPILRSALFHTYCTHAHYTTVRHTCT